MGWTETRLDYEDNPEGDPKVDRTDPLEMTWDSGARMTVIVHSIDYSLSGCHHGV